MALSLSLYLSSMTGALINSAQVRQYAFSPLKNYMGECSSSIFARKWIQTFKHIGLKHNGVAKSDD